MRALRHGIAAAAICSGILVVPAGAQQATTPMAMPPQQPATTRPVIEQSGQHGSWDRMGMRGFSVALVIGDLTGASTADNLPTGAKKALSDMRDFLPYKSYRLLDTHWILCCSSGAYASVAGRLRGAEEGDEYAFSVSVRPQNDWSELGITFALRDHGVSHADEALTTVLSATDRSRRLGELIHKRDELERAIAEGRSKYGERHPNHLKLQSELEAVRRQLQELDRGAAVSRSTTRSSTRPVLDSTFNMKVGETVVIGTSRLKGDKALIALLTAASRNSTAARERD